MNVLEIMSCALREGCRVRCGLCQSVTQQHGFRPEELGTELFGMGFAEGEWSPLGKLFE